MIKERIQQQRKVGDQNFIFFKENKINKVLVTLTRKKGKTKMTVINYEKGNTTDNKEDSEKK